MITRTEDQAGKKLGITADRMLFTPRIKSTNERVMMAISPADYNANERRGLGKRGTVTDLDTGDRWKVYGAACSTPRCQCDAVIVPA